MLCSYSCKCLAVSEQVAGSWVWRSSKKLFSCDNFVLFSDHTFFCFKMNIEYFLIECPSDNSISIISSDDVVCDVNTVQIGDKVKFNYKNKEYYGQVLKFTDDDGYDELVDERNKLRKSMKETNKEASFHEDRPRKAALKSRQFIQTYAGSKFKKHKGDDEEDLDMEDKDESQGEDSPSDKSESEISASSGSILDETSSGKVNRRKSSSKAKKSDLNDLHKALLASKPMDDKENNTGNSTDVIQSNEALLEEDERHGDTFDKNGEEPEEKKGEDKQEKKKGEDKQEKKKEEDKQEKKKGEDKQEKKKGVDKQEKKKGVDKQEKKKGVDKQEKKKGEDKQEKKKGEDKQEKKKGEDKQEKTDDGSSIDSDLDEQKVFEGQMFNWTESDDEVDTTEIPGVVVSKSELDRAKALTKVNLVARTLFRAVFTEEALLSCTLAGGKARGIGSYDERKPCLDQNAVQAILDYVVNRQKKKVWTPRVPVSAIKVSLRVMLAEMRSRKQRRRK